MLIRYGDWSALLDAGGSSARHRLEAYLDQHVPDGVIDLAILSHNHEDHHGGFIWLFGDCSGYHIREFWHSQDLEPDTAGSHWEDFQQALSSSGLEPVVLSVDEEPSDGPLEWLVLGPRTLRTTARNDNDNSLVLTLGYGNTTILFTGDIGTEVEEELLEAEVLNPVDILKVAHHGSNTSTSYEFLRVVQPRVAVISAGGRYGHPTPEVIHRLASAGTVIYRTDVHGTITATWHEGQYSLSVEHNEVLAPVGLSTTRPNRETLELNWYDISGNEDGFAVERKSSTEPFSLLAELPADSTRFRDGTAVAGVQYCYRVYAFNSDGRSLASEEVCYPGDGCFIDWTSWPERIQRGHSACVEVRTTPGTACRAVYTLPSGTLRDLGTAIADSAGKATWCWTIGANTTPGTANVLVTTGCGICGDITFEIYKRP